MKLKGYLFLILFSFSLGVHAMQCPTVFTGATFQHVYVAPPGIPQPWYMDGTYESKGWYIVRSQIVDTANATTITSGSPMAVLLTRDSKGDYYATCAYQINTAGIPTILNVASSIAYPVPDNPNFKKMNETQYLCTTEADHPEVCRDFEVKPRPIIFGRS